jgi:hypothetical protein
MDFDRMSMVVGIFFIIFASVFILPEVFYVVKNFLTRKKKFEDRFL